MSSYMYIPYLPSHYHPFHILINMLFTLVNNPTPPTIALNIIPPIIVVVVETLEEEVVEVVIAHPLEIIRMVNLGIRLFTTKFTA